MSESLRREGSVLREWKAGAIYLHGSTELVIHQVHILHGERKYEPQSRTPRPYFSSKRCRRRRTWPSISAREQERARGRSTFFFASSRKRTGYWFGKSGSRPGQFCQLKWRKGQGRRSKREVKTDAVFRSFAWGKREDRLTLPSERTGIQADLLCTHVL
jgi:hypothetical protein